VQHRLLSATVRAATAAGEQSGAEQRRAGGARAQ
jgi:hypothetical protein